MYNFYYLSDQYLSECRAPKDIKVAVIGSGQIKNSDRQISSVLAPIYSYASNRNSWGHLYDRQ